MSTSYYRVVITANGDVGGDGFVDHKKIEQYRAELSEPATKADSISKEKANSRYELIVGKLGMMANIYLTNIEAVDADATVPATTFEFTAVVERGDDVLETEDEENPGTYLTGEDAIKRCVARALLTSRDDFADYYDPTTMTVNSVAAVRMGIRIEKITVDAAATDLAEAELAISVTKIENV